MVKEKIDVVRFTSYLKPFLSSHKCETITKFKKKISHMLDKGVFKITFRDGLWEAKEFKNVWILDCFFGSNMIPRSLRLLEKFSLLLGKGDSLVKHGVDLSVKLPNRPSSSSGLLLIEVSFSLFFEGQESNVMCPG